MIIIIIISLNGSELRARERIDTERLYLTRCMKTTMTALGATTREVYKNVNFVFNKLIIIIMCCRNGN